MFPKVQEQRSGEHGFSVLSLTPITLPHSQSVPTYRNVARHIALHRVEGHRAQDIYRRPSLVWLYLMIGRSLHTKQLNQVLSSLQKLRRAHSIASINWHICEVPRECVEESATWGVCCSHDFGMSVEAWGSGLSRCIEKMSCSRGEGSRVGM